MRLTPIWKGSPNKYTGRQGFVPTEVVIHVAEGSRASVDSWFGSTKSQVSAHYLVCTDGSLHQYVEEEDGAWHAGRIDHPTWSGLRKYASGTYINPNLYTIGIEHEGGADDEWTPAQYARSAMLLAEIHVRWGIALTRAHVVGHHEIFAPKTCPGRGDIARLLTEAVRRFA